MKVAKIMWPMEYDPTGKEAGRRRMSKEMEDSVREPAMHAAGFLGRMALRGEGQKRDYKRAKLWLERAAELVSRGPPLSLPHMNFRQNVREVESGEWRSRTALISFRARGNP